MSVWSSMQSGFAAGVGASVGSSLAKMMLMRRMRMMQDKQGDDPFTVTSNDDEYADVSPDKEAGFESGL